MSIDYYNKYLKYKTKYIALKKHTMVGGYSQPEKKIILFTSKNCGWCTQFAPVWKDLLKDEELNSKYQLIAYESTDKDHQKFFKEYNINGYPTIINEKNEEYSGERDFNSIKKKYLSELK